MATSRSSLLEGLDEISEEEQLLRVLQISAEAQQEVLSDNEDDEEYKKTIEVSKKSAILIEEEEATLAMMQSLNPMEAEGVKESSIQSKIPECPVMIEREIILY